jgi:hypothetical protein
MPRCDVEDAAFNKLRVLFEAFTAVTFRSKPMSILQYRGVSVLASQPCGHSRSSLGHLRSTTPCASLQRCITSP